MTKRVISIIMVFVMALTSAVSLESALYSSAMAKSKTKAHWVYKKVKKKKKKVAFVMSNGKKATGVKKIGKKTYFFTKKGKLAYAKKERIVSWKGDKYAVKKNGQIRKGWNTFKKSLYYFGGVGGAMTSGTTVDKIPIFASGKAKMTVDGQIKYRCIKILKKRGVFGKSKKKQLRAAWNWTVRNCHYSTKYPFWKNGKWRWGYSPRNSTRQSGITKHGALWVKKYARDMLGSSRGGNCYGFACAFAAFADTIGYDPIVVVARTANSGNRDGRNGVSHDGYSRHAWVKIEGKVYDPEARRVGWRYVYGRRSIGLRCKSVKKIRFSKVRGTAGGGKASVVTRSTLMKVDGKYYYYTKKGKRIRPRNTVVLSGKKYYYFNKKYKNKKGKMVVKDKLYNFAHRDKLGWYMTAKEYKKYAKATKEGASYAELKKLIGEAKSYEETEGCYAPPAPEKIYFYGNFTVNTYLPLDGSEEKIIGVESAD